MKNIPRSGYIKLGSVSLLKHVNDHAVAGKPQDRKSTKVKTAKRMFFLFFVFFIVGFQVQAQSTKPQWWFTYNHTGRFADRWSYGFDLNHRTNGIIPFNSSLTAARMGINYHTKTGFRITAGYAWFGTNVSGRKRIWLHENRLYEQFQYGHSNSKLNFVHRIRIEHRWREQFTDAITDNTIRNLTNRYRYLFQVDGPIKRSPERTTSLRWQAANEFFFHNKEEIGYMLFDQNRTLAGVLISPRGNFSMAVLYQLILQQQPVQRELLTIHSIRLTLFHQLDFRKRKTPMPKEVEVVD